MSTRRLNTKGVSMIRTRAIIHGSYCFFQTAYFDTEKNETKNLLLVAVHIRGDSGEDIFLGRS